MYGKVKEKYDILFLGVRYTKDKFTEVEPFLCTPSEDFVTPNSTYWTNNIYAVMFNREAIKEIVYSMKKMENQFWKELAIKFNERDLDAFYSCVNLIGEKNEKNRFDLSLSMLHCLGLCCVWRREKC